MVIAICSQLTTEQEFPRIRINTLELAKFCNFDPSNKTDMVRTTARRLRSRTLEYQKPSGGWYITGWISSADLLDDGTIEFCIDPKLTPQLLQLKSAYLSTPAAPLMEFRRDYLFWACKSAEPRILRTCMKNGTTVESINTSALKNYEIPIAPLNEQKEIVHILDEIFAKEQQAQSVVESVLADIELLKKSILARAFRGELGTGNPEDERAEELLKRVL